MKRSIPIVCALGSVILLGSFSSLAGEKKSVTSDAATHQHDVTAIETALDARIDCDLKDVPLAEAIEYFADKMRIDIHIDLDSLKEEGVDAKVKVSCHARGLRFRYALARILDPMHLVPAIHNEALYITNWQKSSEFVETRVYDVADLVACRDEKGRPLDDYDSLIDVITQTVSPCQWDHNGGKGTVAAAPVGTARALVVSATSDVHQEVAQLLADLRAIAKTHAGEEMPRRDSPRKIQIGPQPLRQG